MQPFSTPSSLGINVPSVARGHSVTHPFVFVSHALISTSSPEGLGRTFPPSQASLPLTTLRDWEVWTFQSLQKSLSRWPRDQARHGEAKLHFSTPSTLSFVPSPPSRPSSLPAKLAANTTGFSPPLEQMFHLLLLVQDAGQALARPTNPELHS